MGTAIYMMAAVALWGGLQRDKAPAQDPAAELGRVRWSGSLDEARAAAAREVLPVALLFQRVPGSEEARKFGETALSHPLLVEVLETEFVPVRAIKNDPLNESILERYGESDRGGPVLRILDAHGSDLVPRRDDVVDTHGLATRLIEVLGALGHAVPGYLQLVAEETAPGPLERAWIEAPDRAEGEVHLANIPGVVGTRAAVFAGRDTIEVAFRPATLTFRDLLTKAAAVDAASFVFARTDAQLDTARRVLHGRARRIDETPEHAPLEQDKPHLKRSHLRYLPLTPMQAMRINSDLATGHDPARWLSPRQIRLAVLLARGERLSPSLLSNLEPPANFFDVASYEREIHRRLKQSLEKSAEQ